MEVIGSAFDPRLGERAAGRFELLAPLRGGGAVRTFLTVCRKCGGRMRILEVVSDPDDIARMLHGARAPPPSPRPHPPGQFLLFAR